MMSPFAPNDVIIQGIAIFILFFFLSSVLFEPVKKVLANRLHLPLLQSQLPVFVLFYGHLLISLPFLYQFRAIKEEKGIGVAYISSAVELNEEQKGKIEQKLLETTKYQKIEGVYQVIRMEQKLA